MNAIKKLFNYIHIFLSMIAKILLVIMIITISLQVCLRYVFNTGIRWAEGLALLCMIWFTFIGLAIGVKQKIHIKITVFTEFLPDNIKKVIEKCVNLITIFLGFILLIYGIKLVEYTMSSTLTAIDLPAGVMYVIVPISSLLIIYDSIIDLLGIDKDVENKEQKLIGEEV